MAEAFHDTLIDYINWRGDLSFRADPFNEVDNVVLSELVYLDLSKVLKPMLKNGPFVRDVYDAIEKKNCYRLLTVTGGHEDFIKAAASSNRFGKIRVTNYKDVFEADRMQFAAAHFELSDQTSYIAFRGTDNSLVGWREDFMSSFMHTPGQQMAIDYVNETMSKDRDYYIGGHSKGGNLAIYAAANLSTAMRRHILRVFDNDGPGFSTEIYNMNRISEIDPILTKIIPEYDVIGQLFRRPLKDVRIVRSSYSGLLQHDLVSWRVKGSRFLEAEALDPAAKVINDTFDEWIRNADYESRKKFVKDLFDSFQVGGAVTLDELKLSNMTDIIKSLIGSSEETKELIHSLQKLYFQTVTKHASQAIENFAEEKLSKLEFYRDEKKKRKEKEISDTDISEES